MRQTSIQLDKETAGAIKRLTKKWDAPNLTAVIRQSVRQSDMIEVARSTLTDSDFVGFLAELYRPVE